MGINRTRNKDRQKKEIPLKSKLKLKDNDIYSFWLSYVNLRAKGKSHFEIISNDYFNKNKKLFYYFAFLGLNGLSTQFERVVDNG